MKGFHTQGLAILFRDPPDSTALAAALAPFSPVDKPVPQASWMAGDALGFALRATQGGTAVVQTFTRPWPDDMGDPKTDPMLFGAWSMGFFGPFTYPGGLARAVQHAYTWRGAREAVESHGAFVRVLTTFAAGAAPEDKVLPEGYDARGELDFVSRVAVAICRLPGAAAYFDPSGELLLPTERFSETVTAEGRPPVDAWTNIRMARLAEYVPWMLMDTVGMGQLDRDDIEAAFPGGFEPGDVAGFLRNVSLYLLEQGEVVGNGHTLDGPGGRWRAYRTEQGLMDPPRPTLRLFPEGAAIPDALRKGTKAVEPRGFWAKLLGR